MTLTEVITGREIIATGMGQRVTEQAERWGISIINLELQRIAVSAEVERAMNQRRANEESAEAERRTAELRAEAARQQYVVEADAKRQGAASESEALRIQADAESYAITARAEGEKKAEELRAQGPIRAVCDAAGNGRRCRSGFEIRADSGIAYHRRVAQCETGHHPGEPFPFQQCRRDNPVGTGGNQRPGQ